MKKVFLAVTVAGSLLLAGCGKHSQPETELKNEIDLTGEYLGDKWQVAYLHLYYDLPEFYFVPLQDMTEFDSTQIRIWDKEDLIAGRCERELRKKLVTKNLGNYWHGPYMICPIPGRICLVGNHVITDATRDIWGRNYRMFYYTFKNPHQPEETEKKLIPAGEKGVMVLISGGPDGVLQSCAADKSSPESTKKTAPLVETAKSTDFRNFEPFHHNISEPDPFAVLSEKKLQGMKEQAEKNYGNFLQKERK